MAAAHAATLVHARAWHVLLLLAAVAVGVLVTGPAPSQALRFSWPIPEWPAVLVPDQPRGCLCEEPTEAACGCGAQPRPAVAELHRRQAENVRRGTGYIQHMHISHCGGRAMHNGFAKANLLAPTEGPNAIYQGCFLGYNHYNNTALRKLKAQLTPAAGSARQQAPARGADHAYDADAPIPMGGDAEVEHALAEARAFTQSDELAQARSGAKLHLGLQPMLCRDHGRRWSAFEQQLAELLRMDLNWTSEDVFFTISIRHPFWHDTARDGPRSNFFPEVDAPSLRDDPNYNRTTPKYILDNRPYNRRLTRFLGTRNYWIDNYQLRWLAGIACRHEQALALYEGNGACSPKKLKEVTKSDMEQAKNALSRFSHIVIMEDSNPEWFDKTIAALGRRLGVSKVKQLAGTKDQSMRAKMMSVPSFLGRVAEYHATMHRGQPGPPPEHLPDLLASYEHYRELNKYTYELYTFAKSLAYRQISA